MPTTLPNDQMPSIPGDFDPRPLERWLVDHVPGFCGPLSVDRFAGGQSNPTYRLVTRGADYVLRAKPPGQLLATAHAVEREYRVMTALAQAEFPVPRTFALCEDEQVIGRTFFVMELVPGRILWDGRLPDLCTAERRSLYEAQLDTLAQLHAIDPDSIGLGDFGKTGNYFERQVARWSRQYRDSDGPRYDAMDRLVAWLESGVPADSIRRIVHGDYRLDNMVLHPSQPQVAAVLDWELSTLGDPLADLTYFLVHWVTPPAERNSLTGRPIEEMGIPSMDEMIARYRSATGAQLAAPLEWYLAYNLFRLAAILHGVAARARGGNANNARAFQAQERVGPLAEAAWRFAQIAGRPA